MGDLSSYPDLKESRRAEIVIAALALFTAMDINVVSLLIEPIKHDLGLTDVQVGLANSSVLYGVYGILSIPMGILADRLMRVRMLTAAAVLWCSGLVVTGLSGNLAALVAGKAILGAANAITAPAALSLLTDYFAPNRRALAMSSYGVGQVIGGAAAILIGGLGLSFLSHWVAARPNALMGIAPWRSLSLAFALGGVAIIPFLALMREPARQEVRERGAGKIAELWAFRAFLLPLLAGQALLAAVSIGILNWIPPTLTRIYGQQPSDFAFWYSAVSLAAGVGGFLLAGKLVQALHGTTGQRRLIRPAVIGAGLVAPASLMALTPNLVWFAALLVVFMVAYAVAAGTAVFSIGYRIPNELRGAAIALSIIAVSLAGVAGAPVIAWVSDVRGGSAMIGQGMAIVGLPCGLLSMVSFLFAAQSRGTPDIAGTEPGRGKRPRIVRKPG